MGSSVERRGIRRTRVVSRGGALLVLVASTLTVAQAQDGGTSDGAWLDLVRHVARHHPTVRAELALVSQQQGLQERAEAAYRPQVQAGVSAGRQDATGGAVRRATVTATQMVYDFGKARSEVSRAESSVQRQKAAVAVQMDALAEQAAQALIELHRYEALTAVADDQLAALREVLRITELRAREGASTQTDPIQARSRVAAAQAQRLNFIAQAQQWRARLRGLLTDAKALPERAPAPPQAMLQRAVEAAGAGPAPESPSLVVAQAAVSEAQAQHNAARAQRYPTLALVGELGRNLAGEVAGQRNQNALYLTLNSSLYQGGGQQAQERASAHAVEAAQSRLQAARQDLATRLDSTRAQALALAERNEVLASRARSIRDTRTLYREQYLSLGTRTVLDLLNAEQEIALGAQDVVNNRHDQWLAQLGVLVAGGEARRLLGIDALQDPPALPGEPLRR